MENILDIQLLKTNLINVLPILDANLSAAHEEYMNGTIPRGAFEYVRSRHDTALAVIASDEIPSEVAYTGCALLAIDLRTGVKEVEDREKAQSNIESWWQCYRDAGYTQVHGFFKSPLQ